jgi:peptide/nickel transport system substrate-binding protein
MSNIVRGRGRLAAALLFWLLAACRGQAPSATIVPQTVVVPQTQIVTVERVVTATPSTDTPSTATARPTAVATEAQSAGPKRMNVCLLQEPPSLNPNLSQLPAVVAVNEAITGGLIDVRDYQYHPVAFTNLPTVAGGDAGLTPITVGLGATVYDLATGSLVTLTETSRVTLHQADGSTADFNFSRVSVAATVQQWSRWTQAPGLAWEDGSPVTSDDALFAFEVARDPATASGLAWLRYTASYAAFDDHSVQWTGLPGYISSNFFLNHAGFLPRHAYGHLTPAEMLTDAQVNRHPLSYGPFKIEEWVAGDHITLTKNPTYWLAGEDLPRLDELVIRFIPDSNRVIAELAGGECDLASPDAVFADQFPLLRQLEAQGLMKTLLVPEQEIEQLFFNTRPSSSYTGFAARLKNAAGGPILNDHRIRFAIAHCLDRQALVDEALNGAGVVQTTYAPVDSPFAAGPDQVTQYPFDPDQGLELLRQAGWQDTDGDGILDNGRGEAFKLVYSTRLRTRREPVLLQVQEQLRDNCGIDTTIEMFGSEYTLPGANSMALGRRFDLSQLAFTTGQEPPCSLYVSLAIPSELNGWTGFNIASYQNPDFDAACQAALQADDPAQKTAQHALAEQLWSADLPAITLFAPARVAVMRPEVENVLLDSSASDWWNLENYDVASP